MDILILAAGYGKRMKDLTETTPKPLLRFKKKNLLSYALEIAEAIQLRDIYVNVHYQSDQIIKFINTNFPQVKISDESDQILNTGGGIKKVLTQSQDLLILNSDNYWNFDIVPDLKLGIDFFNHNTNITNLLFTHSSKENFDLHIDTNKQITIPSSHYNTEFQGCHLIRSHCLKNYSNNFAIQDQWKEASINQTIYGFSCQTNVTHLGTKELYLKHSG
ncbi:NTP transferase domain-containing protein [Alphaproteobacteria bacterium]|nr:NTP transferase domain-containing protein [Alphaproteobacteria bacterium]